MGAQPKKRFVVRKNIVLLQTYLKKIKIDISTNFKNIQNKNNTNFI